MPRSRLGRALAAGALCALVAVSAACSNGASGDSHRRTPNAARSADRTARDALREGAPPSVRVRISEISRSGTARLRIGGGWRLTGLDGSSLGAGTKLDGEVRAGAGGASVAGRSLPRGGAELHPSTPGDLTLGSRTYPGHLRIARSVDGQWHVYVVTDLETYVAGVVPGEIPASFPREAQRTQAILARTYALSSVPSEARGAPIVVSDSGGDDQEYHGTPAVAAHASIAADAAISTRGLVLFDGATPLRTWYHSTCGGHTTAAGPIFGAPPSVALSGVPCTWCTSSKYYEWSAELPGADVVRAAGLTGGLTAFKIVETDAAGRALRLRVVAGRAEKTVSAGEFRLRVGASRLRSCMLGGVALEGGILHVRGRGWGHGVGLCQIGAKTLAEQSLLAEEIVRTYYPGAQVVRLW